MGKATRKLCLLAMGTALFVVLSLCLQVPVFENYYLCLGYVPMMVFCYYFGPAAGMTVGCEWARICMPLRRMWWCCW